MNQYYHYQPNYSQYGHLRNQTLRNLNNSQALFTAQEGFTRGNMFSDIYSQYKNYQPQPVKANNEQEQLFLNMAENEFAAHDLNIYLDLHPQDGNALDLFNQYRVKANQAMMEYESKYGPLTTNSNELTESPFLWSTQAFPWTTGGM